MKICIKCNKQKSEDQFYIPSSNICKECRGKYSSKYQKDNPEKVKQYIKKHKPAKALYQATYYKKWYAKHGRKRADNYTDIVCIWIKNNKHKVDVMRKVHSAITKGLISRPLECSICGRETRIYAHHEDYEKTFEITWVCWSCHKKIHLGKILVDIPGEVCFDYRRW